MTIQRKIPTGSKTTPAKTNGHAVRKCRSWIESFVASTANLEVPQSFRKWAAISTLAAAVEQKVYVPSGGENLFPNVYCALIGHPGVGKTRAIIAARRYYLELPDPLLAPTSMSASS